VDVVQGVVADRAAVDASCPVATRCSALSGHQPFGSRRPWGPARPHLGLMPSTTARLVVFKDSPAVPGDPTMRVRF